MNRLHAFPLSIRRSIVATAVACCFAPGLVLANPIGPKVVSGQASFATQGNQLTVTNTPGSIINWRSFSIGVGETTRFVQQSTASVVLNRVVGGNPSAILGALQSNGRIVLVNPNGIMFGAGASVNVAGLIASTLNITNADFLAGRMRFGDTPGAGPISNAGEIRTPLGGKVMLISPQGVENSGIIHTPKGEVMLAAGKTVELADSINPEVRVEIAAPDARAVNLGRIVAESGKVGIYGGMVANHGLVNADSAVVGENGKIVFRATRQVNLEAGSVTTASGKSGGTIEVDAGGSGTALVAGSVRATGSAETGGQVQVTGDQVGLVGQASIDVSGERGGGTVLVGGDLQGNNPNVRNARMTYVGADTSIKADAGSEGNGGKVIVWAEDTTRSHGTISARGGQRSGDGGFVETSGKLGLDVTRGPDVRAPAGKAGTWLIDPNDIEIVAGSEFDPTINTGAPFFAPLTDGSRIGVDLINAQLDFGSNVLITTASRGPTNGTQAGNIIISAPITKSARTLMDGPFIGTTTLELRAHNNIVINPGGSITSTGDPLNVILTANFDNMGGGGVTLGAPIVTRGGFVTVSGADLVAINAPINTMPATGNFGGSVQLTSTANQVVVAAPVTGGFFSASGSTGVTVAAPVSATSSFQASSANGTTTIASNVSATGSVTLSGRTGVRVAAGSQITAGQFGSFSATVTDPGSAGNLSIEAGSQITSFGATLISDNMEIQGVVNADGGSITARQNSNGRAITLGGEAGGTLSLTQMELNNLLTTATLTLGNANAGAMTFAGPISSTMPTALSFASGTSITHNAGLMASGSLFYNAPTITISAPVSSTAVNSVNFTADNLAVNSSVTSGGNIDVSTRTFARPIALGVGSPTGNALELSAAQLNNLVAPGRLKFNGTGQITIAGAIAPAGTNTLSLATSNGAIIQAAGATVSEQNLALSATTSIDFQQDNDVSTLAARIVCCTAGTINFVNGPGKLLNVGTVDGVGGVSVTNFSGNSSVTLQADDLNIASSVFANLGGVNLKPRSAGTVVTLGADVGGTLGLTNAELAWVQASALTISGDRMDIAGPVTFFSSTTTLAPLTPNRPVSIVTGSKSAPGELQFLDTEFANLSAGTVVIGGPTAGPIAVSTAFSVPATVGNFVLQSADTSSGITVASGANISATNSLGFTTDVLDLGASVTSTNGNISVATNAPGRNINLGSEPGTSLGLSAGEVLLFSAPLGTLTFLTSAGNISVDGGFGFSGGSIGGLALDAGNTLTVGPSTMFGVPGTLSLRAPTISIDSPFSAGTGVTLAGNSIAVNSLVTTSAGDVNVMPRDFRSIDLGGADTGSVLGLSNTDLNNLRAPSGVLRIGDYSFTGNIHVSSAITLPFDSALSLKTGNGSVTQSAGATITVPDATFTNGRLAIEASNQITLNEANVVGKVSLLTYSGAIDFVRASGSALSVTDIDNLLGVNAGFGSRPVTLTADRINVNSAIQGNSVSLLPTAGGAIDIGTKTGFSFTQAEFDNIFASSVTIGNASSGNITVSQPVTVTWFSDLSLATGSSRTVTVAPGADLSVPGSLSITGGTLNTSAAMTTSFGAVNLVADSITLGGMVTSGGGAIAIRPLTPGSFIDIGGADVPGTPMPPTPPTLGLDATDLGYLSYGGGTLTIGSVTSGNMTVNHAGTLLDSVALVTGGDVTFNATKFGATNNLSITANNIYIPSAGDSGIAIEAGGNIFISPATSNRNIVLGSDPDSSAFLFLTDSDLAKIRITGPAGTLGFDTGGTLTTTDDLQPFTLVPNVSLSAGTLDLTGAPLVAAGNITLRGDSIVIVSTDVKAVTSTGGGRINVTPRTFRSMTLGTAPGGSTVGLLPSQIALLSTSGVVQFGDSNSTSAISITAPLLQPTGSSALALVASGNISQTANSTITASNLRLQSSSGSVTLTDTNNAVGTVAGSSSGNFALTTSGTLNVGTVDGAAGISDSTITLRADALNINETISGGTVTLAPRAAGAAIDLGTKSGGFGITDAEIDRISAPSINIGVQTAGSNPTGAITVSAPVDTNFMNLNLLTAAGSAITVNAALGSATTSSLALNTGLGGSITTNAPLQASGQIALTGTTINVNAPVTSNSSSVSLAPATGATGSSATINGAITAPSSINITADTIAVNALLKATASFSSVNLAAFSTAASSSVSVNQQINAGNSINITTNNIAINAPLVTAGSSVTLQPRTTDTPISVGAEVPGQFSLTADEIALILTNILTIGNLNSSGPLTINAPITSSTLQTLSLQSRGDITQLEGAPIVLTYTIDSNGLLLPAATLNVRSLTGKVTLAAANDINFSVTGQAGGTGQNFVFNNLSPLKIQNLSTELFFAPNGKVLLNAPPGSLVFLPVPLATQTSDKDILLESLMATLLKGQDTQKDADKDAEERKEEGEKAEREDEKKKGTQACS